MRRATSPAICTTATSTPSSERITREFRSLSSLALSRSADRNLPGRYTALVIFPLSGTRWTCTSNTVRKTLMRVIGASGSPSSGGGVADSTWATVPSAGATAIPVREGVTRRGSRKNHAHQAATTPPSTPSGRHRRRNSKAARTAPRTNGFPAGCIGGTVSRARVTRCARVLLFGSASVLIEVLRPRVGNLDWRAGARRNNADYGRCRCRYSIADAVPRPAAGGVVGHAVLARALTRLLEPFAGPAADAALTTAVPSGSTLPKPGATATGTPPGSGRAEGGTCAPERASPALGLRPQGDSPLTPRDRSARSVRPPTAHGPSDSAPAVAPTRMSCPALLAMSHGTSRVIECPWGK